MRQRLGDPNQGVPLVIDNGSFTCRAGWAGELDPRVEFRNVLHRPKHRSSGDPFNLVGDCDPEIVKLFDFTRSSTRSAFDGNVVFQFETMECILDYTFYKLGIQGPEVDHPVLMTECPCNPLYSRAKMAELLFETYGVPSLAFGNDGVFSYAHNQGLGICEPDGLVVSSAYTTTHVIPMFEGEPVMESCCRTPVGGYHVTDYFKRLLTLEYPQHSSHITWDKVESLKKELCYIAEDYSLELKVLQTPEGMEKLKFWQLPWVPAPEKDQPSEEELARRAANREKQGQRLREMAAAKRSSKVAELENEVQYLRNLMQNLEGLDEEEEATLLEEEDYVSKQEVQTALNKAVAALRKSKGETCEVEKTNDDLPSAEKYPLLEIPDDQLNEEQLKEKKRQNFQKKTSEGRVRARQKRQEESLQRERQQQIEEERRSANPEKYLEELKARHLELGSKIEQRKRQKTSSSNNHSCPGSGGRSERLSAVQKERMKLLTKAAFDRGKEEETFGMDDSDWHMYKQMDRDYEEDNEMDEDEAEYARITSRLKEVDPSIPEVQEQTLEPIQRVLTESDFRIEFGVERFRCPEILFQPSMVGIDQAGAGEMVAVSMRRLPKEMVPRVSNGTILLTGGSCRFDGFDKRMLAEVTKDRSLGSVVRIVRAANPSLDAWRGASSYAKSSLFSKLCFTKSDYEENGSDWLRRYKLQYFER